MERPESATVRPEEAACDGGGSMQFIRGGQVWKLLQRETGRRGRAGQHKWVWQESMTEMESGCWRAFAPLLPPPLCPALTLPLCPPHLCRLSPRRNVAVLVQVPEQQLPRRRQAGVPARPPPQRHGLRGGQAQESSSFASSSSSFSSISPGMLLLLLLCP